MSPWIGVFVPPGRRRTSSSPEHRDHKALKSPDVSQLLASNALDALGGTSDEFDAKIKADYEKYAKLIKVTARRSIEPRLTPADFYVTK